MPNGPGPSTNSTHGEFDVVATVANGDGNGDAAGDTTTVNRAPAPAAPP
ncbi:MAG: hypothetical protein FWD74_01300 [Actinomycetia bacterium]|nr:hypothetical protein [Actinomycetes bacterium]